MSYKNNSLFSSVKNLAMSSAFAFLPSMRILPAFKFSSNSCKAREPNLTPVNRLFFIWFRIFLAIG